VNPIQPLFIKEYTLESSPSNDSQRPKENNMLNQWNQPKLNIELNQSQQQLLSFISNSNGIKVVNESMVVETSMSLPLANTNNQTSSNESQNMKKRTFTQEASEQKEEVNSNKRLQIDGNLANGHNLSFNQQKRTVHKASYEDEDEIEKQADADDDEDEESFEDSENYEDLDEEDDDEDDTDDVEEDEDEEDEDEEMEEEDETETLKKREDRALETSKANGLQNTSKQNIVKKSIGSADENTEVTEDDDEDDDDDDDDIQEIDEVESAVEESEADFEEENEEEKTCEKADVSIESDSKAEETISEPTLKEIASKEELVESGDSESKSILSQSQNMQSSEITNTESTKTDSKLEESDSDNSSNQNATLFTHENPPSLTCQLNEPIVEDANLNQNNKENAEEEFDENKYMEMCSTLNTDAVLVENNPNVTLSNSANTLENSNI
jgi:hypothetical protein